MEARTRKAVASTYLQVVTTELLDDRRPQLAGLWLCTPQCNCLWLEGITMLGMKGCIYFPIMHCPVGAQYESVTRKV